MSNKGNEHKKLTWIDRFARNFYGDHARLNRLRHDKREAKRKYRRDMKKYCEQEIQDQKE